MVGRTHSFCGIAIYKDKADFGTRWVVPEFYLDDLTPFNDRNCYINITHDAGIEISLVLDDEKSTSFKQVIKAYDGNLLDNKEFCEKLKMRLEQSLRHNG